MTAAGKGSRPASVFHRVPRGVLALVALICVAAVGAALVAQHAFGMLPCPWCIFQRVLYLAIAAVALVGWATPARAATLLATLLVFMLSAGGIAAAVFQHQVAAQDSSCAFTLADRFLNVTGLETAVPWLFQVTATCAEAASARLLGQPFEVWSGLLFTLLGLTAALLLWHRKSRA
ncbi:disulfide bond formation protein B [Methylibium sp.]|uniref:disulfide bond formation protein B n=1 Tax=Methylibium sp. TaxID=2067992 RepID=UPI003D0983B0